MASVGSPAALTAAAILRTEFSGIRNAGILHVCRGGSGYTGCSQHSWGNAIDISGPSYMANGSRQEQAFLDQVYGRLKLRINIWKIHGLIWRNRNVISGGYVGGHMDHIHISFWPRGWGSPGCGVSTSGSCSAGGTLATWKWRDGHTETRNNRNPPMPEGNFSAHGGVIGGGDSNLPGVDMNKLPLYPGYVSNLVRHYQQRLMLWMPEALPKYGADGSWGAETTYWLNEWQRRQGLPESNVITTAGAAALDASPLQPPQPPQPPVIVQPGPIDVTTATLGGYSKFYHPVLGREGEVPLRENQLAIQDYLSKMSDQVAQAVVGVSVSQQSGRSLPSAGRGDELHVGHGPPVPLNTPGAQPGDDYINVDNGDLYTLK